MMKKIKKIIVCMLICLASLFGAIACSGEPLSIVLVDESLREEVVLNREFDVLSVVENYNKKYTYKLTECYYIDNLDDLKRYDIPVSENTKFTQSVPYEVHLVLVVSRGTKKAEAEFVLNVVIPQNELQTQMIVSWSESGVSKRIEGNPNYVVEGEESSVKVTYTGDFQPGSTNGVNIGSFVCDSADASLTNWNNAVMSFKVFNPQAYDIQMGWLATKARIPWNGMGNMHDALILKAGEWTQVNWSLRAIGLDWNFTQGISTETVSIYFKMRIKDATELVPPYNYTLYFGSLDLVDYSAEEFPDLETRTEEEILAAEPGDVNDKWIRKNYTENTTSIYKFYTTKLSVKPKAYVDGEVKAVETSTAYLEYTMTATAASDYTYVGNFLNFNSSMPIADGLYETCKNYNWKNAYITFWAYHNTPSAACKIMGMGVNKYGDQIIQLPYAKWTKVEVSLNDYFAIETDPFAQEHYELKLYVNYSSTGCHEQDTYQNLCTSLLIDDFKIEEKEPVVSYSGEYAWLKDNYTKLGTTINRWFPTSLSVDEKAFATEQTKPIGSLSESYVAYTMTATAYDKDQYVGNFLDFNAGKPIDEEILEKYKDVDWDNAYLRFWVYNDTDYTLTIFHRNAAGTSLDGNSDWRVVPNSKVWTKVEISLKDYLDVTKASIDAATYNIRFFARYTNVGDTAETYQNFKGLFYITDFEFFSYDANDLIATHYTANGTDINRWFPTSLSTAVKAFGATQEKPAGSSSNSYIEYTMTATKYDKDQYIGNFLKFNTDKPIEADLLKKYADVDWDNAYIRFWIYNDTDYTLTIYPRNADGTSIDRGWSAVAASKTWTKAEISLKDYLAVTKAAMDAGTYNIMLFATYTNVGDTAETYQNFKGLFYITDFEFVSGLEIA